MALNVLNNRKYDILDPIVENIHTKCIKIDDEERKALQERFKRVIEKFILKMKEVDALFKEIYNRIEYTGSYYDGLRVGNATEYDLNLVLKPKLKINTDKSRSKPGFISVVIEEKFESLSKQYRQLSVGSGSQVVIDPNRVNSWLQGVIQRTISKILSETGYSFEGCTIEGHRSGPAWTLVLISQEYPVKTIDVDLVPVLEFPGSKWPVDKASGNWWGSGTWFVVPKPPRDFSSTDWRLSFPTQESAKINGLEYMKYTLRLMKRVRDQFGFKAIASYYVKTLFLWEVEKRGQWMWNSRRGRLFIYMLIRFKEALEEDEIPFFWDERCNLIEHVSNYTLDNFSGRLRRFLRNIDKLIDAGKEEELNKFISDLLSTEEERIQEMEEQKSSDNYCTIL